MKSKKNLVIASVFGLLAIFIGAAIVFKIYENKRMGFLANENAKVFVRDHAPTMGAQNPEVYLVEFLDPECEACRAFAPFVKELVKEHEDKVQLVVRYAPFHPNSIFAVKILEAARKQGKYWETLDVLFKYQPVWGSHHNPQPELIWHYLPEVGLDVEQVRKDMEDPAITQLIQQDIADGKTLNVRGTPSFFINGKPLERFGKEELRRAVLDALE